MAGASPHLPSVTAVSVDTLFLVVMVCVLIEVRVRDYLSLPPLLLYDGYVRVYCCKRRFSRVYQQMPKTQAKSWGEYWKRLAFP